MARITIPDVVKSVSFQIGPSSLSLQDLSGSLSWGCIQGGLQQRPIFGSGFSPNRTITAGLLAGYLLLLCTQIYSVWLGQSGSSKPFRSSLRGVEDSGLNLNQVSSFSHRLESVGYLSLYLSGSCLRSMIPSCRLGT